MIVHRVFRRVQRRMMESHGVWRNSFQETSVTLQASGQLHRLPFSSFGEDLPCDFQPQSTGVQSISVLQKVMNGLFIGQTEEMWKNVSNYCVVVKLQLIYSNYLTGGF